MTPEDIESLAKQLKACMGALTERESLTKEFGDFKLEVCRQLSVLETMLTALTESDAQRMKHIEDDVIEMKEGARWNGRYVLALAVGLVIQFLRDIIGGGTK